MLGLLTESLGVDSVRQGSRSGLISTSSLLIQNHKQVTTTAAIEPEIHHVRSGGALAGLTSRSATGKRAAYDLSCGGQMSYGKYVTVVQYDGKLVFDGCNKLDVGQ